MKHRKNRGRAVGRALAALLVAAAAAGGFLALRPFFAAGEQPGAGEPPALHDPAGELSTLDELDVVAQPDALVPQGTADGTGSGKTPGSGPDKASDSQEGADSHDTSPTGDVAGGVMWPALSEERRAGLSNQTVGWGQGTQRNQRNQPQGALDGQEKYGDLGGYFIFPEADDTVYLTFDLGYENGHTADILDALKEKGVHGTFFVTMDYVKSAPELVQRIIDEGHVLGNHSVHHPSMPACSEQEARDEVMGLHDYVKENFGGYEMTLFRFPRGEFSEKTLVLLRDLGYASVFWSYAYVDWNVDDQPDVAASLQKLTDAAHPGAIYLLHTVSATNAALMGDLVDNLTAAGYTVGEMPH